MATMTATANCFVTTYKIGNEQGYSTGKRFELGDYSDKAEFMAAAIDYAKNELGDTDPEIAFPDYETNFDSLNFIDEYGIDDKVWDVMALKGNDLEIMLAYLENSDMIDNDIRQTVDHAQSNYIAHWECEHEFARDQLRARGIFDLMPNEVMDNLNLTACANQFATDMMVSDDGHYFNNQ